MPTFDWRPFLAAASSAVPGLAEQRAGRRQQRTLERGQQEISDVQAEADQRIADEIEALQASDPRAERAAALSDFTRAAQRVRGQGQASEVDYRNLPGPAGAERAAAETSVRDHGRQLAERMATLSGARRQRVGERQSAADAQLAVEGRQREAEMAEYLARLEASQQGRVDPWVNLLSGLGTRIARNYQTADEDLGAQPDRTPGVIPGASGTSARGRLPRAGRRAS